jgi:hypothetical protein
MERGLRNMAAWEESFNGFYWHDMPGMSVEDKKINFAGYRRGLFKMEEIRRDVAAEDGGGVVLVTKPDWKRGLAHANYRRSVAAAKRGRSKLVVRQWSDELSPSEKLAKAQERNRRDGQRMRLRIKENGRQQKLLKAWQALKVRCGVADKPLQMLREAFVGLGGAAKRVEAFMHGNAVLYSEAEALMWEGAMAVVGRRLDERDALRDRVRVLARSVDLCGVRGVDFGARLGVSQQMVRDIKAGNCRAALHKLPGIVAELERMRAAQKGKGAR